MQPAERALQQGYPIPIIMDILHLEKLYLHIIMTRLNMPLMYVQLVNVLEGIMALRLMSTVMLIILTHLYENQWRVLEPFVAGKVEHASSLIKCTNCQRRVYFICCHSLTFLMVSALHFYRA